MDLISDRNSLMRRTSNKTSVMVPEPSYLCAQHCTHGDGWFVSEEVEKERECSREGDMLE